MGLWVVCAGFPLDMFVGDVSSSTTGEYMVIFFWLKGWPDWFGFLGFPLWKGLSWKACPGKQKKHTPWKINMEPTNHAFRKENDLPNLHYYVPAVNLPGCTTGTPNHQFVVLTWAQASQVSGMLELSRWLVESQKSSKNFLVGGKLSWIELWFRKRWYERSHCSPLGWLNYDSVFLQARWCTPNPALFRKKTVAKRTWKRGNHSSWLGFVSGMFLQILPPWITIKPPCWEYVFTKHLKRI